MITVRCLIDGQLLYPDSDRPGDLSIFWGLVAGYQKKKDVEIQWGFRSVTTREWYYEGDEIEVDGEVVVVKFENGSFLGTNEEGQEIELSTL